MDNEIKPSREIWNYYNRDGVCQNGITIDLIISSIADVLAGYGISYSATELLLDLGCLTKKKSITKKGKLILAHELHERYHRGIKVYHHLVNPLIPAEKVSVKDGKD